MSADFEREITHIAAQIEPTYTLAPETIHIAVASLEEVDRRYGPDSDNPLPFHNAPHSLGVARRSVRLNNILYRYIKPQWRPRIFDLGIIAGTNHDREQDLGPAVNEQASAEGAVEEVIAANGVLNTKMFKQRLIRANLATAAEMQEDGKLIQPNLQKGSRDPIKFIMGFVDINGIAMEGDKRMWPDATNIYYETTDEPTSEDLCAFLIDQRRFLRHRLNDGIIKSDIAYYFPDDIDPVYKDMRKAFHGNIARAFSLAVLLGERSELQHSVSRLAKGVSGLDRSSLGDIIGKMIRSKVSREQ